jgi:hypothetical protein
MKFTKLFSAVILVAAIATVGCKGKSKGQDDAKNTGDSTKTTGSSGKDLLVNKWVLSELSGEGTKEIADSVKEKMIGHTTIEFKSDGTYEGMNMGEAEKGTYKLSDDGKTLYNTESGKNETDTVMIGQIQKDKAVFTDMKKNISMTMTAH